MKTKIIFSVSIIAMILLSVGCNKELTGIEVGQEFKLTYNQKATITDQQTGESIKVKFEELIVDSRCPTGALCMWEGAVTIELLINNTQKIQVTHSAGSMNDTIIITDNGDYKVALIEADPYPIWNITTNKRDYVATLKIMR
jgi:PBP1b-binding outer membrane lipoprotein LpoB